MSYHRLWEQALPYLNVRHNDEHTRYSFRFAEQLVVPCHARPEIALPAIILHDVGWSTVPPDKLLGSFGPQIRYPEFRRQHEVEGARISAQILADLSYPAPIVAAVTTIIDGQIGRAHV